jgi:hypothetical protein
VAVLAAVAFGLATPTATAVPYASAVTDLGGGDYSFVLNEDADNVVIKRFGDSALLLGPLTKGTYMFNIGMGTGFEILVSNAGPEGWFQFSDDDENNSQYYSPKGVAVNINPATGYFGWIYVCEGYGGPTAAGRVTTDGLYVMTADQADVTGQGDLAYDGGVDWLTGGGNSPFKPTIAPDDTVYITDWSDGHSGIWRAAPDGQGDFDKMLADETNINDGSSGLYDNHGSVASVYIEGSGESTVMFTLDEDYPDAGGAYGVGRGDILRYDIGTATEYTGLPVIQVEDETPPPSGIILNGLMDVVRDESSDWWITQYRWTESPGAPSLTRWEDGSIGPIYNSAEDPNLPLLTASYGSIDIHNGVDMLVMGARSWYGVYVLGISDPDNPVLLETLPQSGYTRDVAFDAAGNIYVVSNSSETLRIWSPGGNRFAVTGSDGDFSLPEPMDAYLDIKPGSCPNSFNRGSSGTLPLAIVGTDDFDPTMVDVATVSLVRADGVGGGVAPGQQDPEFEDGATPFDGEWCDCHEMTGDGIVDLVLHFDKQEVVQVLELDDQLPGALVELLIMGQLYDGSAFIGSDCLRLVPPGTGITELTVESNQPNAWISMSPPDAELDGGGYTDFVRTHYYTTVVTLTAPEGVPGRPFMGWNVDGIRWPAAAGRTIQLAIEGPRTVEAIYGKAKAHSGPKQQQQQDRVPLP